MARGKKDLSRLIKIKHPVYNPKIGKTIEITYYVDPNKLKPKSPKTKKTQETKSNKKEAKSNDYKNLTDTEKQVLNTFACNL